MRYTPLLLSVWGLASLSFAAPASTANDSVRKVDATRLNTTESALPAGAEPKEADDDDVFVYQWRSRQ
ncbi:hypothetical protein GGR51DRAFT_378600 [Nemania sp. FL0031]|nr:hypothetical protein GGR51DRAFT_378600 [Nemania sp. FL0031]